MIVLRADDNGQGGAFALFSLLKRQAELGKKSKVRPPNFLQKGSSCGKISSALQHPDYTYAPALGSTNLLWIVVSLRFSGWDDATQATHYSRAAELYSMTCKRCQSCSALRHVMHHGSEQSLTRRT